MDAKNRFFTPGTYTLTRLEYLFLLLILAGLAVQHYQAINWWIFVALIAITDGIGYIAGAIAHRRQQAGGRVAPIFYILYNAMHNVFFAALVMGIWWYYLGFDWTLLAMPIHLCIDRSIFGNFFKPIGGVAFEPQVHPAFAEFERQFEAARRLERSAGRDVVALERVVSQ